MKLALVPIPDDATDTAINLSYWQGSDYHAEWVPVPEDDQLRKDLEYAVDALEVLAKQHMERAYDMEEGSPADAMFRGLARERRDAAMRLRAGFNPDTEDE